MKKNVYLYVVIGLITLIVSCSKNDSEPPEPNGDETVINFQGQIDIADDMIDNYENLLVENSAEQSRALLVESLKDISDINDAGISEDGTTIYWEFSDGLEYYFLTETSLSVDSEKGNGRISNRQNLRKNGDVIIPENKNALILSPYYYQWSLLEKPDESDDIRTMLNENGYNVNYKLNAESSQSNISLDDYKNFSNYSVIAISTHGGISKDGEVFINSGVPITEDLKTILKDDIENKRVAVTFSKKWMLFDGPKVLALKSSWFDNEYDTKLNQTLVHIGACKGYYNQSLSNALIGSESAFLGWTDNVNTFTNRDNAIDLFENLVEGKTVEEAYNQVAQNGSTVSGKASFELSSNSYKNLALKQKSFEFTGIWQMKHYDDETRTSTETTQITEIDFQNIRENVNISESYSDYVGLILRRYNAGWSTVDDPYEYGEFWRQRYIASGNYVSLTNTYWTNIEYRFYIDENNPNIMIGESIGLSNKGLSKEMVKQ